MSIGGDRCERDDDYLNEPQIYLIGGPRPSSTPFSFALRTAECEQLFSLRVCEY